ncbi:dihydropteroate synthase [Thermoleophilia bacterium SCSIO 60948]|nr:dihydropteroate synthase [Thermoleophilia bacterium SCSIO 60948]
MGILNATPDSFSDGGLYLDREAAVRHGDELAEQGAEILDVGGESTRPGADPVSESAELARTEPVVAALSGAGHTVSIDTSKAAVARAALDAGARIVNDVTALRGDPEMAPLCAERGCEVIVMHMLGEPRTMQDDPRYDDVVAEVGEFLAERIDAAVAAGVERERVMADPGIGFGKTTDHNLELLSRLGELRSLGVPLVVGTSRKGFIGRITGREVGDRLGGTIASNVAAALSGADVLRVHEPDEIRRALRVAAVVSGGARWRDEGVAA